MDSIPSTFIHSTTHVFSGVCRARARCDHRLGKCVPPVKPTNADLERMVDTSDEWIVARTGIRERRLSHVEVTDLAEVAALHALAAADIDLVVPYQVNQRIIKATITRLGINADRVVLNIATHGNTSAASVPMALSDALADGRIAPAPVVLQTASGGGLTWATNIMGWGDRIEPIASSTAAIADTDLTVFDLLAQNRAFPLPSTVTSESSQDL